MNSRTQSLPAGLLVFRPEVVERAVHPGGSDDERAGSALSSDKGPVWTSISRSALVSYGRQNHEGERYLDAKRAGS